MSKTPRPLAAAEQIAAAVIADLGPHCERISVAGSVRRRMREVGDLEVVAIPRVEQSGGLFGDQPVNLLWEHLHMAGYCFMKGDNPSGRYYQLAIEGIVGGMQLDLFLADEDNFGLILLIRTGPAAFSAGMLAQWKRCQRIGKEQPGSKDGRLVTRAGNPVFTPEEAEVFRLCQMAYVPPEQRKVGA
jgi:DNA polymerase/3'-5' exonuclease PolX